MERVVIVLMELGLVEQRYAAVLAVINEAESVTDVAFRFGVTRQTVHRWLRRYADEGLAGLEVAIVGDTVEISAGGELLKVHPIRHDRSRENGAFANAGGRPSRINAA